MTETTSTPPVSTTDRAAALRGRLDLLAARTEADARLVVADLRAARDGLDREGCTTGAVALARYAVIMARSFHEALGAAAAKTEEDIAP